MRFILSVLLSASLALATSGCHRSCKRMQKTNGKLISGKYDFGKNKEAKKYKRKNRHG
jgi:hypothetical protein